MSPSLLFSVITSVLIYDNPPVLDVTESTFSTSPRAVMILEPPSISLISIPEIVIKPSASMEAEAPELP